MVFHFKHAKVSGKADGGDNTLVRPSDWNADHTATADGPGLVGRQDAGVGDLSLLELGSFQNFTGEGKMWWGDIGTIPAGWLPCDGRLLLRADYPDLFAVISTRFDSTVDSTHFRLPDTRGRVLAGIDNNPGSGFANRLTNPIMTPDGKTVGARGGEQSHVLTVGEMPVHNHALSDPGHAHSLSMTRGAAGGSGGGALVADGGGDTTLPAVTGASVDANGGGLAHTNVQPTILVFWIIKT